MAWVDVVRVILSRVVSPTPVCFFLLFFLSVIWLFYLFWLSNPEITQLSPPLTSILNSLETWSRWCMSKLIHPVEFHHSRQIIVSLLYFVFYSNGLVFYYLLDWTCHSVSLFDRPLPSTTVRAGRWSVPEHPTFSIRSRHSLFVVDVELLSSRSQGRTLKLASLFVSLIMTMTVSFWLTITTAALHDRLFLFPPCYQSSPLWWMAWLNLMDVQIAHRRRRGTLKLLFSVDSSFFFVSSFRMCATDTNNHYHSF